ncbi:hypothetical protein PS2_033432 [Malus domestica]
MGFVVSIFSIAICASVLLLGVSAEVEANIGTKADDSTAVEEAVANAKCWREVDCEYSQFIARQATSNFVFMENVNNGYNKNIVRRVFDKLPSSEFSCEGSAIFVVFVDQLSEFYICHCFVFPSLVWQDLADLGCCQFLDSLLCLPCDMGSSQCVEGPKSPPPADDSATAVGEVIVDTKCWRHVDCEFAVQCPPGDIKFCVRGNCECVEGPKDPPPADEALKCVSLLLRASAEVEAEDKTVDTKLCLRDVDCEYVITCPPGGLKLCNTITRECICIGGQTGPPLSVEAPNSAVAVEGPVTLIADTEWKAKKLKRASESSVSSPN